MNTRNSKQFKCLYIIALVSMTLFICHMVFQNKFILTFIGLMSLGSPFMPIIEICNDIVTEVYGWVISMRFNWISIFSNNIFNWFCYFWVGPSFFSFEQNSSFYNFLLGKAPFVIFFGTLFYIVSYKINAYLLIKWKIILKGKYFWLRSLASTAIGDTIFLILMNETWIWFNPVTSQKEAMQLTLSSIGIRMIFYVILAFPSTVIVTLLKIIEQVDAYDYGIKFNPFIKEKSTENET